MFRTIFAFILGVHFGQEYGLVLPNVKNQGIILYNNFLKSDFYKKVKSEYDLKKSLD